MKKLSLGNKGSRFGLPALIFSVVSVGLVVIILGLVYFRYFDIKSEVQESDVDRHAFTLGNIFLSSEKLAYSDGDKLYRGIFDKNKIDNIKDNSDSLFNGLAYPASSVEITIEDTDSNNKWYFSGNGPPSTQPIQTEEKVFQITFPVVIRFSENDFHIGKFTLKLTERSLA